MAMPWTPRTSSRISICLQTGDDGADIDGDGDIDAEDFFGYLDLFAAGC